MAQILGIDIGGSGIKGAPVDTDSGDLLAERHRIPTPQGATPAAVAQVVRQLCEHFSWTGPVGCTFPAIIQHGVALSAANVDKGWIGTNVEELLSKETGLRVSVLNDADAAGLAEVAFGAARGQAGVVLLLTLGTGIGSALVNDGVLVPNTEFGHMEFRGKELEHYASDRVREEEDLSWERFAKRLGRSLRYLEGLFSPDLIVLGGGVSKKSAEFLPLIELRTPIVPAKLRNSAGIVGAAMHAGLR
ncbi:polyphosphate--glucose phosphotransferase [Deinococcus pimensis]|uniref:polyphosphate--glucose phosphotransferase n=1 Tax=Deinococcus pimensis TaxID=309888 RepID=UPI0004876F52|nr:ROK family protein [Deinococcus pimensis]